MIPKPVWVPWAGSGVVVFDASKRWLKYLRTLAAHAVDVPGGPNSMNRYGRRILSTCALVDLRRWVEPHAEKHFGVEHGLKTPSAFTVEYDSGKQRRLTKHRDSSDITLNICIDGDFTGGDLVFYNGRKRIVMAQSVGGVFIHKGSLEHRAMPITAGTRTNLVAWFRKAKA